MKKSGFALVGAALLMTLGFATASVTPASAAPASSIAAQGEFQVAQWDRDRRDRWRPRCRRTVHYGWKSGRCVRVDQRVCRGRNGRVYVTDRYVTRAERWRCRRGY